MLATGALYGIGGHLLINCCLQTGQSFVITYVITLSLSSGQGRLSKNLARCVPERCLFADGAAQNSSIPEEASARLRKQGRVRHRPNQCHYSVTESRNQIGAIVTLFCRIRCEHDRWKGPCRSILF